MSSFLGTCGGRHGHAVPATAAPAPSAGGTWTPPTTRWRDRAACRLVDADLFIPAGSTGSAVQDACLRFAFETQPGGGGAGRKEDERRRLRKTWRAGRPRPTRAASSPPQSSMRLSSTPAPWSAWWRRGSSANAAVGRAVDGRRRGHLDTAPSATADFLTRTRRPGGFDSTGPGPRRAHALRARQRPAWGTAIQRTGRRYARHAPPGAPRPSILARRSRGNRPPGGRPEEDEWQTSTPLGPQR